MKKITTKELILKCNELGCTLAAYLNTPHQENWVIRDGNDLLRFTDGDYICYADYDEALCDAGGDATKVMDERVFLDACYEGYSKLTRDEIDYNCKTAGISFEYYINSTLTDEEKKLAHWCKGLEMSDEREGETETEDDEPDRFLSEDLFNLLTGKMSLDEFQSYWGKEWTYDMYGAKLYNHKFVDSVIYCE